MDGLALGLALLDQVEQLGGHYGAGVRDLLGASLGDDVGSAIRSLDASISRGRPPGFDLFNLSFVQRIFSLACLLRFGEKLKRIGGRNGMRVRVASRARHDGSRRNGTDSCRAANSRSWSDGGQHSPGGSGGNVSHHRDDVGDGDVLKWRLGWGWKASYF